MTYSYLANSPLVTNIWFTNNSTLRMTTTKAYDYLNRLTNISSSSFSSSFDYVYNPASQRTSVTNVDGSYWVYNYDAMGQVTSGKKYWSDGTTVAGQQFDYSFDDIGNRQSTTRDNHATLANAATEGVAGGSFLSTSVSVSVMVPLLGWLMELVDS